MIGKLDKRVQIFQQSAGTDDGMGGKTSISIVDLGTFWAQVKELSSSRSYIDNTIDYIQLTMFIFRLKDITKDYWLRYNTVDYTIDSVVSDDKWTIVKAFKR